MRGSQTKTYLLRLDDASEYMDTDNWVRMEELLDNYNIRPIVGIIPDCHDNDFLTRYGFDPTFWEITRRWEDKGWTLALHGYQHVYCSGSAGINPYFHRSEFAGLPLEQQEEKIEKGYAILRSHGIEPGIFFAPSHTFDNMTLDALRNKTEIRVISDTIALDIYYRDDFYFLPLISSAVRDLPFRVNTFCYHPNGMRDEEFVRLEQFLIKHKESFVPFSPDILRQRDMGVADSLVRFLYFAIRRMRRIQ